ncbi:hypothetical protein [Streptococcus cuniculi]|uniref:DUF4355 domain-containing protein n=1 Tax=Streptococcus cuniculi TaxID=1432788 RepID=A0A4Y9JCK5_9STRE|nr:hypothetical protein [Streptococcus cuniculi]MBF0778176.1 hypothetical protein [Streptococcus cuniculi]TFU97918.1 hypothetical protein E4T82_05485 [Streptococcus cuniculi]
MVEDIQETTDQSVNTGENVESQTQESKTFTQEEVTGLVAKESKKAQEKIFKSLGFEDIKSAKDGLAKLKEWQDSQKSESEKQAEALAVKEQELESALSEKKTLEAKLSALTLGVNTEAVDDVIILAERLVSDDMSIDDAIGQVLKKYPQFSKQEAVEGEKVPTITVAGNPSAQTGDSVTKEQFNKMTYLERVELKQKNQALFERLVKGD